MALVYDDTLLREPGLYVPGRKPVGPVRWDVAGLRQEGVVAYWPMVNRSLRDVMGGYELTATGAVWTPQGWVFASSGDRLEIAQSPVTRPANTDSSITVLVGVTPAVVTDRRYVFALQENSGAASDVDFLACEINESRDAVIGGYRSIVTENSTAASSAIAEKDKYSVCGVVNTGKDSGLATRAILNRELTTENNLYQPKDNTDNYGLSYLYIGLRRRNGSFETQFLGTVHWVAMMDQVISQALLNAWNDSPYRYATPV